jgi:hypothetical protein
MPGMMLHQDGSTHEWVPESRQRKTLFRLPQRFYLGALSFKDNRHCSIQLRITDGLLHAQDTN